MTTGAMILAAAVVGGLWTDGKVRFETGCAEINAIMDSKEAPCGAYSSTVAASHDWLRHTGSRVEAKRDWQSLYDIVEVAASNRCDISASKDPLVGACYWAMDARMMCEIAVAVAGRFAFFKKYVPMYIEADGYIRERFLGADGMLKAPMRGEMLPSALVLYLGLVDGEAAKATERDLEAAIGRRPLPSIGAQEWKLTLDALSRRGKASAAYGLLIDGGKFVDHGAAVSWLWRNAAGIASDPNWAGFNNVILAPKPDRRLGFVNAEYMSAKGIVKSAWRYEGKRWIWDFTVPPRSVASVTLPGASTSRQYDGGTYHIELEDR